MYVIVWERMLLTHARHAPLLGPVILVTCTLTTWNQIDSVNVTRPEDASSSNVKHRSFTWSVSIPVHGTTQSVPKPDDIAIPI